MNTLLSDIVNATGKYVKETLPGVAIYDKYPEQNIRLPCVIVQITNSWTKPRISGRYRLVNTLVALRVYSNDNVELKDIVSTILLTLREIELPDGPVLVHSLGDAYMSDGMATMDFRVSVDMQIDRRDDPPMLRLDMNERIKK